MKPARLVKQGSLLVNRQPAIANSQLASAPRILYVSITMPITNHVAFSTDLIHWTPLLVTNCPVITLAVPMTNSVGFFSDVTADVYGQVTITVATNAP